MGVTKVGDFDIEHEAAARLLSSPNPDGRPNSDVLRPFRNGSDLVRVCSQRWIIDFGVNRPLAEAALYAAPFEYLVDHVKETRLKNNRQAYREKRWIHADCAASLKQQTLTNLYNQRPAWLDLAHKKLDAAVFAAYGWDSGIRDEELLERLLRLTFEREAK
jgi:hypothetical protein